MKKNATKVMVTVLATSLLLGGSLLQVNATDKTSAIAYDLRITDQQMFQRPAIEELIASTKTLTQAEKDQLRKDDKELAPLYEKITKLTKEIDEKREQILSKDKTFQKYEQIIASNQKLWDKLNSNLTEQQAFMSDEKEVIKASKSLTEEEKQILLSEQDKLDALDAKINQLYAKVDEATKTQRAQLDEAFDQIDAVYVKSASIWDKIYVD